MGGDLSCHGCHTPLGSHALCPVQAGSLATGMPFLGAGPSLSSVGLGYGFPSSSEPRETGLRDLSEVVIGRRELAIGGKVPLSKEVGCLREGQAHLRGAFPAKPLAGPKGHSSENVGSIFSIYLCTWGLEVHGRRWVGE